MKISFNKLSYRKITNQANNLMPYSSIHLTNWQSIVPFKKMAQMQLQIYSMSEINVHKFHFQTFDDNHHHL